MRHVFSVLLVAATLAFTSAASAQSVPHLINYQGQLTDADGNPLPTAAHRISVSIYDQPMGGTRVWGPQVFDPVVVVTGHFNVILGTTDTEGRSIAGAFDDAERYIGVSVDDAAEIQPRQRVLSGGYALEAGHAHRASRATVSDSVEGEHLRVDQASGDVEIGTGLRFPDGSKLTRAFPTPDFDSGWFPMSSDQGANSFKEVEHGMGVLPNRVKVLVRAIDGNNSGFVFEGSGTAQNDDDSSAYGGVVFAYNATHVRLWAPDKNNGSVPRGNIVSVIDGWGGEVNSQVSNTAEVRVLVWK